MVSPYDGLRILDFSHVIAGPLCTRLMADLGAEVIKVEPLGGDLMRHLPISYAEGMSTAFAQYNCGKRAIGLDLKHPEGRDIAQRLSLWADVVVENFSLGVMDRLGLGWETLHTLNRRAIMVSISLFGRTGPRAEVAGFGAIAEAASGLMMLAGKEDGTPARFGTPLADMCAGVHAVAALGAALYEREVSGEGRFIDISMFDCLFTMIDQVVGQLSYTEGERKFGNFGGGKSPQTVPSGVLKVANGEYITFSAVGDALFGRLASAMNQADLAHDSRFIDIESRIAHRDELYRLIDEWALGFRDAATLLARLGEYQLPAARIRSVEEAVKDRQLTERGTLQFVDLGVAGQQLVQSAPYRYSGLQVGPKSGPPAVGEHTDSILSAVLGMPADEVVRLRNASIAF